jgi:hypothetical protein
MDLRLCVSEFVVIKSLVVLLVHKVTPVQADKNIILSEPSVLIWDNIGYVFQRIRGFYVSMSSAKQTIFR